MHNALAVTLSIPLTQIQGMETELQVPVKTGPHFLTAGGLIEGTQKVRGGYKARGCSPIIEVNKLVVAVSTTW
jgi:hypothetical protein